MQSTSRRSSLHRSFLFLILALACALCLALPNPAQAGQGRFFEKLDTDGDGRITEAEFLESAKERFSKMDENGDGAIDASEAEAMRKSFRENRRRF